MTRKEVETELLKMPAHTPVLHAAEEEEEGKEEEDEPRLPKRLQPKPAAKRPAVDPDEELYGGCNSTH
jgi:hypothetical protein